MSHNQLLLVRATTTGHPHHLSLVLSPIATRHLCVVASANSFLSFLYVRVLRRSARVTAPGPELNTASPFGRCDRGLKKEHDLNTQNAIRRKLGCMVPT
jgi:hypothetical protein